MGKINWLSLIGSILALIGTLIIVMDSFKPIHNFIDNFKKWENIRIGLKDLDTLDTKIRDNKTVGMLETGKPGFDEVVNILKINRVDLKDKEIVSIVKNAPITVGGVPFKIVHVAFKNNPNAKSLTTDDMLYEWVNKYRWKYFLKWGLVIIFIGFLLSAISHFYKT